MHSDRIVMFGQSCAGKTTFANQLLSHRYCCFDALFHWHLVEAFGLSSSENLAYVKSQCEKYDKFVLDGWHLNDQEGKWLPIGAVIYVIYCEYEQIIRQYRIHVGEFEEHRPMFKKWYYEVDYGSLPCRYFLNQGDFLETTRKDFELWKEKNCS